MQRTPIRAAADAPSRTVAVRAPARERIDAHHHVWTLARGDYGWLTPALAPIHRDFTLDDLKPLRTAAGVAATVLVQAAPTVAETEFLLATARASGGVVRGVVGWVDLAAADAIPALKRLARDPLLKSVRPMLQDLADPAWLLRADVGRALAALPRLNLRFDALVRPRELPALLTMLEQQPALAVVVNHGGKPAIARGEFDAWADAIAAVAAHPRVRCKLSGLVTEASPAWTIDELAPLRRPPARLLRPAAADVGQRLAGRRAGGRLPALERGDDGAAGRPVRRRSRGDPRRHRAPLLRPRLRLRPPGVARGPRDLALVDVALQLGAVHDGRRDLLDRLRRRVEHRNALAIEQTLALAHLVAAVLQRRVLAVRAPLGADVVEPLRVDGEPEQPVAPAAAPSRAAAGRRNRRA